jgi:hypothetical protein
MTASPLDSVASTEDHTHGNAFAGAYARRVAAAKLLSPLGERLGEGVMQETIFAIHPLT